MERTLNKNYETTKYPEPKVRKNNHRYRNSLKHTTKVTNQICKAPL